MAYYPLNPNGQATMANSSPVVIASDQSTLTVDTELPAAVVLSDSISNPTAPAVGAYLMGLKTGTSQWARIESSPDNADGVSGTANGSLRTNAILFGYNGTTFDRVLTGADNADAIATAAKGHVSVLAHTLMFNGTTWDRARGDTTNGIDVDVTRVSGTVTVSGTVAATQSGTWTVQPGNTANTTAWLVTGTGGTFPVTDSGGSLTVDNGGTFAVQATIASGASSFVHAEDDASLNLDAGAGMLAVRKATPANTSGADGDYEFLQMSAGRLWTSATIDAALPAGTNAIGKLASNSGVTIGAVEIAAAQTLATVTTVSTVTSITNTVTTQAAKTSTATLTNVAGSATSVQLLASTAGRIGATFYNDSTAILYLKFGTTASTTSFTVKLYPDDYYELSTPIYTGRVDGIWASAAGSVRITELT